MASSYEKSVKGISDMSPHAQPVLAGYSGIALMTIIGATKVKLAAPKSKYIEHLLMATQVRQDGICIIT